MPDSQTQAMSLREAYDFGETHGLGDEIGQIRDMIIEWDLSYTSTLRRGYIVELFENKGLFSEFKNAHWSHGNTLAGEAKRRRYLAVKSRYEDFLSGANTDTNADLQPDGGSEETLEFALESHLRDFLVRNLDRIEPGLKLHVTPTGPAVEFPVDGGRIDILAIDSNGKYVAIELKLSRGRNRALGQLLYYMGWIDRHMGSGPCRGIIVASEITDDLVIAVARAPGVELAKYRMNFAVDKVEG